jgi:hypothetical protein
MAGIVGRVFRQAVEPLAQVRCCRSFTIPENLVKFHYRKKSSNYTSFISGPCRGISSEAKLFRDLQVVTMDASGQLQKESIPMKQAMKGMHARDILALGVSSVELDQRRPSPPVLLPRGNSIFVSFGNIKAVIHPDSLIALEPHRSVVSAWLADLSGSMKRYGIISDTPFELFVLEDILCEMCDTFDRRMMIYGPLVNSLLVEVDSLADASEGFNKLVPLKDALYQFEMAVKEAQRCILDTIDNDVSRRCHAA